MVKFGIIFLYNLTNHEKNKYKNTIAFKTYFLLANELICNTIYFDITYGNSIPLRMSVTIMRLYVFLPHYSLICNHITENSLDKK